MKSEKMKSEKGAGCVASGSGFFSVRQACEYLSVSRATLYKHLNDGLIQAVKLGGHTLIPVKELDESIYTKLRKFKN